MQLRPKNNLTSGAFANIYRNKSAKGDRASDWAYAKKKRRQPSPCRVVTAAYNEGCGEKAV